MEYKDILQKISDARALLSQEKYQESLDLCLEAMSTQDIDNYNELLLGALITIALCYQGLQNYPESIWYCQEFIRINSSYAEPYVVLAELYTIMEMYTLAEAMIDTAFKYCKKQNDQIESQNIWTYKIYNVASVCKYNIGDLNKAIEYAEMPLKDETIASTVEEQNKCLENLNNLLDAKIQKNKDLIKANQN